MMIEKPVVLLLSGGVDSVTLLYDLVRQKCRVHALHFDYGQRNPLELKYSRQAASALDVPLTVVQLQGVFPKTLLTGGGTDFVVPNRNQVFLSIATSLAVVNQAEAVAIGCCKDDWEEFADCRPGFVDLMNEMSMRVLHHDVEICAPYSRKTKVEIVGLARELSVSMESTTSCYVGSECGKCFSCLARAKALSDEGAA